VLLPLGEHGCGLVEAAAIAEYLSAASARQCGPCLFGLRASSDVLASMVDLRGRPADVRRLVSMLDQVTGRGACHHPDGAVRMIRSAMAAFAADAHSHVAGSGCRHPGDDRFFPTPAEG
jgi:NADH:ubiquinone oxidoreductase subunit F (NADH-binding)